MVDKLKMFMDSPAFDDIQITWLRQSIGLRITRDGRIMTCVGQVEPSFQHADRLREALAGLLIDHIGDPKK